MMKKIIIAVLVVLSAALNSEAKKQSSPLLVWDLDYLQSVKTDVAFRSDKAAFIKRADKVLGEPMYCVTAKEPKLFAPDKHEYVSVGPYWWPDPKNPDGPYIRRDGVVNQAMRKADNSAEFGKTISKLKALSVAFFLTGESKYRDVWLEQLRVWFLNPDTYMRPDLEYGQVVPGQNGNKGRCYGLIEMYAFNGALESYRLMEYASRIPADVAEGFHKWVSDFADWMWTSELGQKEYNGYNNHATAYDVTLFDLCIFCGKKELADKISSELKSRRLDTQIEPDGSQPKELARTRAMHYSLYNAGHIVDFCTMQQRLGNRFYKQNQAVLDSIFLFLYPYIKDHDAFMAKYKQIGSWSGLDEKFFSCVRRLKALEKPEKGLGGIDSSNGTPYDDYLMSCK